MTIYRAVTLKSLEREVWGSNLGPVKLDIVLLTARHCHSNSSKETVLPGRKEGEMGSQTRYTLQSNTARIIKDLILYDNMLCIRLQCFPVYEYIAPEQLFFRMNKTVKAEKTQ